MRRAQHFHSSMLHGLTSHSAAIRNRAFKAPHAPHTVNTAVLRGTAGNCKPGNCKPGKCKHVPVPVHSCVRIRTAHCHVISTPGFQPHAQRGRSTPARDMATAKSHIPRKAGDPVSGRRYKPAPP